MHFPRRNTAARDLGRAVRCTNMNPSLTCERRSSPRIRDRLSRPTTRGFIPTSHLGESNRADRAVCDLTRVVERYPLVVRLDSGRRGHDVRVDARPRQARATTPIGRAVEGQKIASDVLDLRVE